jgi:tRNA (cytidine/uridine-2'-O-)-methyltransferase
LHHDAARFEAGDALVFGAETRGLPLAVLDACPADHRLRIPMLPDARSLNLSNAVAVAVYEAWRQLGFVSPSRT